MCVFTLPCSARPWCGQEAGTYLLAALLGSWLLSPKPTSEAHGEEGGREERERMCV